jgi:predicted MFS family arabinose efflux permease
VTCSSIIFHVKIQTFIWKAERYFWAQNLSSFRIHCLCSRLSGVWLVSEFLSAGRHSSAIWDWWCRANNARFNFDCRSCAFEVSGYLERYSWLVIRVNSRLNLNIPFILSTGALNVIFVLGQTAGSQIGGILADGVGWRWSFLLQTPLLSLGVLSVVITIESPEPQSESSIARFKRVDFVGALLLVLAIVALLVGLDQGGNAAWLDTSTIGALLIFLLASAAFWMVELKVASEPFAPCHMFTHKGLIAPYMCDFFSICSDSCLIFFLPLFFQAVESQTAAHTGTALIPAAICATIGTLVGGWSVQRTGKYRGPIIIAYSIQAIGTLMVTLIIYTKNTGPGSVIAVYAIASFGCGFGITATVVAIVANAGKKAQAIATAVSFLFRSTGAVIGITIGGAIVQNALRSMLRSRLGTWEADIDKIVDGVRASLTYIDGLPPSVQMIVQSTYRDAVLFACIFATACTIGGVLSSLRIIEVSVYPGSTEVTGTVS